MSRMLTQAEAEKQDFINKVNPFVKGLEIIIPKGILIYSTKKGETYLSKKTYRVKVHHCLIWIPQIHNGLIPVVVWAGAGRYWSEAVMHQLIKVNIDAGIITLGDKEDETLRSLAA